MVTLQTEERLSARLRGDLLQSYHEGNGPACLVVKDPRTGRFFRFGEIEGFILGRLSGQGTTEQLQQAVEEQFGAALPKETLDQFIAKLGRMGLLENAANESPTP